MKRTAFALVWLLACAATAAAQPKKPISPFVIDVHAFFPNIGQDSQTARDLDVQPTEIPSRVLGLAVRGQFYPIRGHFRSVGVGAELIRGRGRNALVDALGTPTGVVIGQVLEGFTGFATINFGRREGWSYLGAGMGPMRVRNYVDGPGALAIPPPAGKMTLTFGGGARWFKTDHFAFSFDVRFYQLKAVSTIATVPPTPGRAKQRLLLMSAGVGIR
jgi:hypothetical protein